MLVEKQLLSNYSDPDRSIQLAWTCSHLLYNDWCITNIINEVGVVRKEACLLECMYIHTCIYAWLNMNAFTRMCDIYCILNNTIYIVYTVYIKVVRFVTFLSY